MIDADPILHNVHSISAKANDFNVSQPKAGMAYTTTLKNEETMLRVKCDVHSWMTAYIGVVSHPYFAVSGSGGAFELHTVPPGTYTIEAVHEKLGRQTQSVTLGEKDAKEITFTFKPKV